MQSVHDFTNVEIIAFLSFFPPFFLQGTRDGNAPGYYRSFISPDACAAYIPYVRTTDNNLI